MKYVYQLVATGPEVATGSLRVLYSSTVFTAEELAVQRINKFREAVTSRELFYCLENPEITIKRLEIVE